MTTEISELIVEKMREKSFSNRRLARLLGVHPQTIVWWRSGRRVPQTQNIMALSAALGVAADELLNKCSNN